MKALHSIFFLLFFSLFLLACGGKASEGQIEKEQASNTETESASTSDGPETYEDTSGVRPRSRSIPVPSPEVKRDSGNWRGLLFLDERGMYLHDCNRPGNKYRLRAISTELREQYQTRSPLLKYPGEPLVAELSGVVSSPSEEAGFQGELTLHTIVNIRARNPRNNCMPYDFYGMGNEPFWNVYISDTESVITYKSLGDDTALRFPYQSPKISGDTWTYFTRDDIGNELEITVNKGGCSDSMAGTTFDYRMKIKMGEKEFAGCASKGEDR
jgi:uncharacterized membrane protein